MKRFFSSLLLCAGLLAAGTAFITRTAEAEQEDLIAALLRLPAPPPPNPLVVIPGPRDEQFYDTNNPPRDDAPIEDLIDYWTRQSLSYTDLRYSIRPSSRISARLIAEMRSDPNIAHSLMNAFIDDPAGIRAIKDIYDAAPVGSIDRDQRSALKSWLKMNSNHFPDELERSANRYGASREYVSGHEEFLAFAKQDWARAETLVRSSYMDENPAVRVGAMWALYRHALANDSLGDIDRYRSELIAVVEDKSATAGARDLAFDALVTEKEWSGRDDWYYTLLGDETLAELRVNGSVYTGLTTLILYSPADKYKDKMIELVKSDNRVIRQAAARNLATILARGPDTDVVRALLPWLADPDWAKDTDGTARLPIVRHLGTVKMPESVMGLISIMNERSSPDTDDPFLEFRGLSNSNSAVAAANVAVNTNAASSTYPVPARMHYYPYRYTALEALRKQADIRAVPALRKLLNETNDFERSNVVRALWASGGFTIPEQVMAVETAARRRPEATSAGNGYATNAINAANTDSDYPDYTARTQDPQETLGTIIIESDSPSEELVQAVIARLRSLERREPVTAAAMRSTVQRWGGAAAYSMMISDLKAGKGNVSAAIKLLADRKQVQAIRSNDLLDLRSGSPESGALAACILEDENEMAALLSAGDGPAAAAVLSCGRLIRASLPIERVAPLLSSDNKMLSTAATLYLDSEDSPAARTYVLARFPETARITGATTHFPGTDQVLPWQNEEIGALFASVSPYYSNSPYFAGAAYVGELTKIEPLQEEVLSDGDLLGIYNYQDNYIRIYADKAVFSVTEDESRYRERTLTIEEFDHLKEYLASNNIGEMAPFLSCSSCEPRQLLMVGKTGGRRIFVKSARLPDLFRGLDSYFDEIKRSPLKLKYNASKTLPGLEVLFDNEKLSAEAVWKSGSDLRILIIDRNVRERVRKEIEDKVEALGSDESEVSDAQSPDAAAGPWAYRESLKAKREYEGIKWFGLANNGLGAESGTPAGFDIPPSRDIHNVAPEYERWKTRGGDIEIRIDGGTLLKLRNGKMAVFKQGYYADPVISSDGRWALANHSDEEENALVRIDVATGRETKIATIEPGEIAIAYIPSIRRFLIGSLDESEYAEHDDPGSSYDDGFGRVQYRIDSLSLLDPDTGTTRKATGELRPILHQSFRRLQPTGRSNEFWAAIPDSSANETAVGLYDAGTFGFREVLRLPKITIDSLDMWVDQGRLYFVYKGHVLTVPIPVK